MTPLECAEATGGPIGNWGGKFMMDMATFAKAAEVGATHGDIFTEGCEPPPEGRAALDGMESYMAGRFGVLGNVDGEQVTAAAVVIAPELLSTMWNEIVKHVNPIPTAHHYYAPACHDWGRTNLEDTSELARFCELAAKVVDAASPTAAPLFCGWRLVDRPSDTPALAAHMLMLLRELRFARHSVAILSDGMTPLEAILSGPGGEGVAQMFQWQPPFPDVSHLKDRRQQVEAETNRLAANDYAALTDAERQEFADILISLGD